MSYISVFCSVAAMCFAPTIMHRANNQTIHTAVTNQAYGFLLAQNGTQIDLGIKNSTETTFNLCSNPQDPTCIPDHNYTAGAVGTTGIYESSNMYFVNVTSVDMVPSQPDFALDFVNHQVMLIPSLHSSDYGAALTGCYFDFGIAPYEPTAQATYNTVVNGTGSYGHHATENTAVTINSTMLFAADRSYDMYYSCYNSHGQSISYALFAQIPVAAVPSSNSSSTGSSMGNSSSSSSSSGMSSSSSSSSSMDNSTASSSSGMNSSSTGMTNGSSSSSSGMSSSSSSSSSMDNSTASSSSGMNSSSTGMTNGSSSSSSGMSSSSSSSSSMDNSNASSSSGMNSSSTGMTNGSSSSSSGMSSSSSSSSSMDNSTASSSSGMNSSSTGMTNGSSSSSSGMSSSSSSMDNSTASSSSGMNSSSTGMSSSSGSMTNGSSSSASMTSSSSMSISSSSSVIVPDVPVGTVVVSFSIDLAGEPTVELAQALQGDIAATIAAPLNLTTDAVRRYVIVKIGNVTSSSMVARRLLSNGVAVEFTLLGNISDIASTTGGVTIPVDASIAVTSVVNAITSGNATTIFTTAATLGATVPAQIPVTQVIVQPEMSSSSSSTGLDDFKETSDSSLSGGAVAGIVIGCIVGVLLLVGVAIAAYTGSLCFKRNGTISESDNTNMYNSVKAPKSHDLEVV